MTDDVLDRELTSALRAFAEGGVRPIDPVATAETAIRRPVRRPSLHWWSPTPTVQLAGSMTAVFAAVVVVAFVASLQGGDGRGGVAGAPSGSPDPGPSQPAPTVSVPDPISGGTFRVTTPAGLVLVAVPSGWHQSPDRMAIFGGDESYERGTNAPSLGVHDVEAVVRDACPSGVDPQSFGDPVGPSAEDLIAAIKNIKNLNVVGPNDMHVGRYPAQRLMLSFPDGFGSRCGGPEGRLLWRSGTAQPFGLLNGGMASVYILDVDGVPLVLATHFRGASRDEQIELIRALQSTRIESSATSPTGEMGPGRSRVTVDGIPITYEVPTWGWERFGRISLNKSIRGPQGAEAILYWATYPDSPTAIHCWGPLDRPANETLAQAAQTLMDVPGLEVVEPAADSTVGGLPAVHVTFVVRETNRCNPGFFYLWNDVDQGAMWTDTHVGATIRVWLIDVDDRRLFIGGISAPDAGPELEQEMESIVASIHFE